MYTFKYIYQICYYGDWVVPYTALVLAYLINFTHIFQRFETFSLVGL